MKKVRRKQVYEGKLFDVVVENWGERERELVEHPGSVTIVPIDADGRIVLTRQFREAARKQLLELPAGMLDEGEAPLAAAKRELAEETGLHGGEWRELRQIHPSPGILREPVTIFLADRLEEGERKLEDTEKIDVVRLAVPELEARLGELEDAKTLVGVLLYLRERR
ncbi:MAG: NUDIX hydrolase [Gaiellaceae bacterium MAG52_C11]|nr:NUDIX hydrolase [Candidatus Gaiellasilicea maunaloa]